MRARHLAAAALAAGLLPLLSPTARSAPPDAEKALVDLIVGPADGLSEKAFAKGEYKAVRAAFARYFEARHGDALKVDLGADADPLFAFLAENAEVRETLFTAIDPLDDKPAAAMAVFRDLWRADPAAVKANDELAVAVAVVWDNPAGVYDYRMHQVRTKSTLPETVAKVGAVDNFRYALDRQAKLKGPQQQLPWEFQVHAVNHRTPVDERDWAVTNYLKKRSGIGSIYKEIVYDTVMLQTRSEVCKLNGKPYTLPSIREHGGVCAMQADFAARVAKSVLVPAEYIHGEGNSGGLHAWVMWAEVKAVNKEAVTFTLESFGRYNIDHYYVGSFRDPKTGRETTDRDMERRLTAVGTAPANSRHADLLMRAYPVVSDGKGYTPKQQVAYLNKVLALYPMCEGAWRELARLHDDGKLVDPVEATRLADKLLVTFVKFPDFSWRLLDDLLTPVKDKRSRAATFLKAVGGYENLGRPDLACDARLKLAEYLADGKDFIGAFNGLAFTVKKFPDEGRYVPRMVARMQEVAKELKGGDALMAKFYLELLPKVPTRRGNMVSEYCVRLHEQALAYLKETNHPKEAAQVEQNLARVKGGK
ncbi:MAG: hypothetical protein C0501_08630 [Isosphaera sp.]|nr:hypothetical protein [Isosphaera sp.]